jgi:predicted enzyme related to lactoylglutathione lyase
MPALAQLLPGLAACAGRWRGTNRLHDPHTKAAEDSPSTLSITPVVGGKFLRIDYTWTYQGAPQEGTLLVGTEPDTGELTAHWSDTWHMDHKVMACRGSLANEKQLVLRGSFAVPPGPDWGWRIELTPEEGRALRVLMFNVSPEGVSQPAVEATYAREPASATGEVGTERGLADIRQIAITVKDVGRALAFYRDVLGLKFLFAPSPELAFLSAGSVRLMLSPPQGAGKVGANSILYFRVDNIESVHQAIVQRGAVNERAPQLAAKMPDHELWISFLRDPENNLLGLMEERRAAPAP